MIVVAATIYWYYYVYYYFVILITNCTIKANITCIRGTVTHIAGSLASVVHTNHKVAVEAAAPPGGALRVRDDGHGVNSLKGGGKTTGSTGTSPSSDSSIATRVVRAGHDGSRGDVAARWSAAGPHNRKVIGGEAGAATIAGMLKTQKTNIYISSKGIRQDIRLYITSSMINTYTIDINSKVTGDKARATS